MKKKSGIALLILFFLGFYYFSSRTFKYERNNPPENLKTDRTAKFKVDGISSNNGDVIAEKIEVNGVFSCAGNVEANEIFFDGVVKILGNINSKNLTINGVIKTKGAEIKSDTIKIDGILGAKKARIITKIFECDGVVDANRSEIFSKKSILLKSSKGNTKSKIYSITAEEVDLENAVVEKIKCKNIIVRDGCEINELQYEETLDQSSNAKIKNTQKLPF